MIYYVLYMIFFITIFIIFIWPGQSHLLVSERLARTTTWTDRTTAQPRQSFGRTRSGIWWGLICIYYVYIYIYLYVYIYTYICHIYIYIIYTTYLVALTWKLQNVWTFFFSAPKMSNRSHPGETTKVGPNVSRLTLPYPQYPINLHRWLDHTGSIYCLYFTHIPGSYIYIIYISPKHILTCAYVPCHIPSI